MKIVEERTVASAIKFLEFYGTPGNSCFIDGRVVYTCLNSHLHNSKIPIPEGIVIDYENSY